MYFLLLAYFLDALDPSYCFKSYSGFKCVVVSFLFCFHGGLGWFFLTSFSTLFKA